MDQIVIKFGYSVCDIVEIVFSIYGKIVIAALLIINKYNNLKGSLLFYSFSLEEIREIQSEEVIESDESSSEEQSSLNGEESNADAADAAEEDSFYYSQVKKMLSQ